MSKELYMAEHERLTCDYMEKHGCDWATAYDATADKAYDALRELIADRIDDARQRAKDARI